MLPFSWMASAAQRVLPVHLPVEHEGVLLHAYDTRCDDSPARKELGVHPRPLVETYRDTVRWLYHAGWLTARQAGTIQQSEPPPSGVPTRHDDN